MAAATMTKEGVENIPAELRKLKQWLVWKLDENGKKPPYSVETGRKHSPLDPEHWITFKEAVAAVAAGEFDGVGFAFTEDDPYIGIDVDGGENTSTENQAFTKRWREEFGTYTEHSPSRTGYHMIAKGKLDLPDGKHGINIRFKAEDPKKKTPGVEVYDGRHYFTMTGDSVGETPDTIRDISDLLPKFIEELQARTTKASATDEQIIAKLKKSKNAKKFETLFVEGSSVDHEGDESRADIALAGLLTLYTRAHAQIERIMRRSKLVRSKWDDHPTYLDRTITKSLENALDSATGDEEPWGEPEELTDSAKPKTVALPLNTARSVLIRVPTSPPAAPRCSPALPALSSSSFASLLLPR